MESLSMISKAASTFAIARFPGLVVFYPPSLSIEHMVISISCSLIVLPMLGKNSLIVIYLRIILKINFSYGTFIAAQSIA